MKNNKFKTTLKCSGCVDRVTPYLNEAVGTGNWEVELNGPIKMLTVHVDIEEAKVKTAMEKAGYKAELIK
jgi:copper chaperone CopZ